LGASCIIVGDDNKARLELVKGAGYETVDTANATPVPDQIEQILGRGQRWVDGAVDCVGLECHGYGPEGRTQNEEEAVLNLLMQVIKPAGHMGIPGVYTDMDPGAPNDTNRQGKMALAFPRAWVKSPAFMAGQCPVMHYNRDLTIDFLGWLSIHGVTELGGLILFAAGGLVIAEKMLFPGRYSRLENLAMHGRLAGQMAVGAVIMLFAAAFLEGGFRQLVQSTPLRFAIGFGVGALWVAYFTLAGREQRR